MASRGTSAGWFSCPECGRELESRGDALHCASGHVFPVGRRGYVSLVLGRSPLVRSDPVAVLDAVDADWADGRLGDLAQSVTAMLPASAGRVIDCGSDLGHLLAAARAHRPALQGLFLSSSPSAIVRSSARSGAAGLLVDPSRPWPVRDGAADVVLSAFAHHRPAEFARVLSPGGVAILVMEERSSAAVEDDVYPWFEHDQTRRVEGPRAVPVAVTRFRRRRRPLSW